MEHVQGPVRRRGTAKRNAASYLTQRWKEPPEVYTERLNSVFYENYIGSIVDWYAATVFRREPLLTFDGVNDDGKSFFYDFTADCDLTRDRFDGFPAGATD